MKDQGVVDLGDTCRALVEVMVTARVLCNRLLILLFSPRPFASRILGKSFNGEILVTAEICLNEWKLPPDIRQIKDFEAALQNITSAIPSTSLAQN